MILIFSWIFWKGSDRPYESLRRARSEGRSILDKNLWLPTEPMLHFLRGPVFCLRQRDPSPGQISGGANAAFARPHRPPPLFFVGMLDGRSRNQYYTRAGGQAGRVAKLVDAQDLGSCGAICEGSSPFSPTNPKVVQRQVACGSSSVVEHRLAKARVESSNLFSRSTKGP